MLQTPYQQFVSHLGDREYFGQKLGLERIQEVLNRLGNPERQFQSIHIAGTNGKGSTAAMLASIFKEAGYQVGLFTSPHLVDFCERIQVNGELISQDRVMALVQKIKQVEKDPLTFFEMATVIGFLHFADAEVDIAVIETGLGGRLDATNVLHPVLSIITTIGYDHMQHLGDTLEKIAFEKAGIIKEGVPVVTGPLPEVAMKVVQEVAKEKGTLVIQPDFKKKPPSLSLSGEHQIQNAQVSVASVQYLSGRMQIPSSAIQSALAKVSWPGRLETIQKDPWILLDGAHNVDAMRAVRCYLEKHLKGRKLKVLFGAMADKDLKGILEIIEPLVDQFIFTSPTLKRSASPEALASLVQKKSVVIQGVSEALDQTTIGLQKSEVLLVTGSFFVVGEAKIWFAKLQV